MRISDWSSDVCSSDLIDQPAARPERRLRRDDMVADGKLTQQRRGHRRHAARLYPARLGALDQRDPFLEHLDGRRSEEHTSELQSLMRISYAVFCLKKKKTKHQII